MRYITLAGCNFRQLLLAGLSADTFVRLGSFFAEMTERYVHTTTMYTTARRFHVFIVRILRIYDCRAIETIQKHHTRARRMYVCIYVIVLYFIFDIYLVLFD